MPLVGGGLHAVVQWRPDEIVLQSGGEIPVRVKLVVCHEGQVQAEAVLAVVGREVVAVGVEGFADRKSQVDP